MFMALVVDDTGPMNDIDLPLIVTIATIVGAGLMAGVYFTFSTFTMGGLRRLPPEQGAAAMQAVNVEAVRPALMSVFFGTAVLVAPLYVLAILEFEGARSLLMIGGGSLYLASIVITAVYNVPLNDRLEAADPASPHGQATWAEYQRRCTRGNHLRLGLSMASMTVLTISLVV